jgi:four helix bundle protein
VTEIYEATEHFPAKEVYGLVSQLRRAAVSVPSNIAEGQARFSKPEFRHFLRNAKGSLAEIDTQLVIAYKLGLIGKSKAELLVRKVAEVGRMASGLISKLDEG